MAQAALLRSALLAAASALLMCVLQPAWAQSTSGCTTALIGLAPCLGFISGNSSGAPSSSCCSQLASVVQTEPQCLCSVLGGGDGGATQLAGISINQTQALALPSACNVKTPPVSQCKNVAAGGPTTPAPATPSIASGSPSIPQGGSKSTPGLGTSDGGSVKIPLLLAAAVVFLGACTTSNYLSGDRLSKQQPQRLFRPCPASPTAVVGASSGHCSITS